MSLHVSRRAAIMTPLIATTLGNTVAPAQASNLDYSKPPTSETIIGHIPATLDLDYGAGAVWSSAVKAPICFTYSEGIAARFSAANLLTGEQIAAFEPFHQDYDRPEAFITYPNRQTVTIGTSGLVIHFNSNTLKAITYKRDTRPGRESVYGQLSNIAIGSSTWPAGLDKSYIGDSDGRLCRFILPPNSSNPNTNIWISYGQPFGAESDILSTAFHQGFLYVGVRGENAGLYRINESALDEAANTDRPLELNDFENLTPDAAQSTVAPSDYQPFQLLITDSAQGPLLVARINGTVAVRIRVDTIGLSTKPKILGTAFELNQIATADRHSIITRKKHGSTWYLVRLDMNARNPHDSLVYVGNAGPGTLVRQTPLLTIDGKTCAITTFQDGVVVSSLGPGAISFEDASVEEPFQRITTPTLVPATRTQLYHIIHVPAVGNNPQMLAFAPKWIQDQRIGLIDNPHAVSASSNNTRIRLQSSPGRPGYESSQIESFGHRPDGLITTGTYSGGGAQLINAYTYSDDSQTSDKPLAKDNGDPKAARLVCQTYLSDGNTLYGATGKFNEGAAGLAIFKAQDTATTPTMTAYPDTAVIPQQNITAVCSLPSSKGDTVLAGGNTRLENSATSAARDVEQDAVIAVLPYNKDTQMLGAVTKTVKLPAGVKAVWDILRHSSGRIFVLAQYGHHVTVTNSSSAQVTDANVILELDAQTFEVIPTGNKGQGTFVYTTSRTAFAGYGALKETPTGQLLVRTNVFIHCIDLAARGVKGLTKLPMTCTSFDIGAAGEIYTANYDGYVRRFVYA